MRWSKPPPRGPLSLDDTPRGPSRHDLAYGLRLIPSAPPSLRAKRSNPVARRRQMPRCPGSSRCVRDDGRAPSTEAFSPTWDPTCPSGCRPCAHGTDLRRASLCGQIVKPGSSRSPARRHSHRQSEPIPDSMHGSEPAALMADRRANPVPQPMLPLPQPACALQASISACIICATRLGQRRRPLQPSGH